MSTHVVVILAGSGHTGNQMQLSLSALDGPSLPGTVAVHAVHPETLDLEGVDWGATQSHPWSEHRSLSRVINELLSAAESDVVFLVPAGAAVHPADLEDASAKALQGVSIVEGWPLDVPGLTSESLPDSWPALRGDRGANTVAVAVTGRSKGVVGVHLADYFTLRGLDVSLSVPDELLDDLHLRARRFGLKSTVGPTVLFAAKKLNELPRTEPTSALGSASRRPIFRNLTERMGGAGAPLVSIVISTFNRSDFLGDCINSILAQSFRDFELVLVDDGSTDATQDVVSRFSDPRIRCFRRENSGISAARNFGIAQSRGTFIAVHDDDDLMLPWRLESQLAALEPGDHGSFGVSVHFDNSTGETHDLVHRLFTMQTALRYGNNPTHPTWLIRRDVINQFGYDETLESGVDNNVALRMIRSGVRFRHTGIPLILRRMHAGQITRTAGETQKASASMSQRMLHFANGGSQDPTPVSRDEEWLPSEKVSVTRSRVMPYLPDHLVTRAVTVRLPWSHDEAVRFAERLGTVQFVSSSFGNEAAGSSSLVTIADVTWPGLVEMRAAGLDFEATAVEESSSEGAAGRAALERWSLDEITGQPHAESFSVRLVSRSAERLAEFVSASGLPGVAHQSTTEGEQQMAALLFVGDLTEALTVLEEAKLEALDVLDASVMVRGDIRRRDVEVAVGAMTGVDA